MIIRSQRERQVKLAKKSIYNLSDEVYEDSALCFSSVKDDFDFGLLSYEDDDLEAKRLKHLNTNRNRRHESSGDEERRKSKKEVMEEIIMKIKLVRKAKQKEEKEKLMDKNFKSLENSQAMDPEDKKYRTFGGRYDV